MIKILLITYAPWRDDRTSGETYTNIFGGMSDKLEFAQIYFKDIVPKNNICKKYYLISHDSLIYDKISKICPNNKLRNCNVFKIFESIAGYYCGWDTKELKTFITSFNPDVILVGANDSIYANRIIKTIHKKYRIPVVSYIWDDSFNMPLRGLPIAEKIKISLENRYKFEVGKLSSNIYTINPLMQSEYNNLFNKQCRLLYKGFDFSIKPPIKSIGSKETIKLVYLGTLCNGRDLTLRDTINQLTRLKHDGYCFHLDIYSMSERTLERISMLNEEGISCLKPIIPSELIHQVLQDADILLHVESFSKIETDVYRLSLSAKIVEYFYCHRCILSIGGATGTTQYLSINNAAIVQTNRSYIYDELKRLYENPNIIDEYAVNAWNCGKRNHDIKIIQDRFFSDISILCK